MGDRSNPRINQLRARQVFALQGHTGERIEACSGHLWITQDGDIRDVVIGPRESFTLDRPGRVHVSAFTDASFAVRTDSRAVPRPAGQILAMYLRRVRAAY